MKSAGSWTKIVHGLCAFFWHREDRARQVLKGYLHEKPCSGDFRESPKNAALEDKQKVKNRIAEASQYVPLERLCLSPQCGFASTEEGNKLTEKQQWNKIRLMLKIAHSVWKNK